MADIRLIAAVGRSGQLGLGNAMPWQDPKDVKWFADQTRGGIVIMGARTMSPLAGPFANYPRGRTFITWSGKTPPAQVIADMKAIIRIEQTPQRIIWIAGGAHTYEAFMPFVQRAVITRIDYDGPADAWMPPLWKAAD